MMLPFHFVKKLLEITLQPSKPTTNPSRGTSEVLRYLLNKDAVAANMVEGGRLLHALRIRNDWVSILPRTFVFRD